MSIPEVYATHVSECCRARIDERHEETGPVGYCRNCQKAICRLNPRTARAEWLGGHPPNTKAVLRPMGLLPGRDGATRLPSFALAPFMGSGRGQGGT